MPLTSKMRSLLTAGIGVLAFGGGALAADDAGQGAAQTLAFTVDSEETERGTGDTGAEGLSLGDTYVSNGVLRDEAGDDVGTSHVSFIITDELDAQGSAWSTCSTAAVIDGQGTILAQSIAELLEVETSGFGFGVAPPMAEFAIVGGADEFAGAAGQVISTREPSVRKLEYVITQHPA